MGTSLFLLWPTGHLIGECPLCSNTTSVMSGNAHIWWVPSSPYHAKLLPCRVVINYSGPLFVLITMIDLGVSGNFNDQETVNHLKLPIQPLSHPIKIQAIDEGPIGEGTITRSTWPLPLRVRALHHELNTLLVTSSTKHPVILGLPWMERHNPQISWSKRQLTCWTSYCQNHCLNFPELTITSMSIESPKSHSSSTLPPETGSWVRSSAKPGPVGYHHIGPMTVPLSYFLEPTPPPQLNLPIINSWTEGYGGVYSGGAPAEVYQAFHIPCIS